MPLYEYECDVCAHRFEVIQKFSDAPLDTCPKCGGAVRKLLSSPAIQFKGTGWYITDYARSGKSEGTKTDGKPEAGKGEGASESTASSDKPTASGEAKAESKPAAKAESKADSKP